MFQSEATAARPLSVSTSSSGTVEPDDWNNRAIIRAPARSLRPSRTTRSLRADSVSAWVSAATLMNGVWEQGKDRQRAFGRRATGHFVAHKKQLRHATSSRQVRCFRVNLSEPGGHSAAGSFSADYSSVSMIRVIGP